MAKNKIILLIIGLFFIFVGYCYAGDSCYDLDLPKISEDLQSYQNCKESYEFCKKAISELENQNKLLKEQNELLKKTIENQKLIIQNYEDTVKIQEKMIKASKPSFFQRLSDVAIGVVGGIVLGFIL